MNLHCGDNANDLSQIKMVLQYFLLVSLFCSSLSYDKGLRLYNCPSIQSTQGSKGSHFEIAIQKFNNACTLFLSESDLKEANNFPKRSNDLDMQLTVNKERANITWSVMYKKRCHRRIFMLDVEYRIQNAEGDGAYVSYWCFQYNLSKGDPKQKESVTFYFDCIRTIPDREAYLINIKLWSLQQNRPLSSRTRRSVKSDCSGIRCTTSLKEYLEIGPIEPITDKQDDQESIKLCQCWNKSSINLEQNIGAKSSYFSIVVANPNPYAKLLTVKVYQQENDTFPVFSRSISHMVHLLVTDISCENEERTYTPVLGYDCGGGIPPKNDHCLVQHIHGPSIQCPVKKKYISPTHGIPDIKMFLYVVCGLAAVMIVTGIVYACKARKMKPKSHRLNNCLTSQSSDETEMINLEEVYQSEKHQPEHANPHKRSKQIMLLYHIDSTTSLLRKDCVNLITELLTTSNIDVLGLDRALLFRNWIEFAERASKDDITEFLIIISKELVSFHKFYMMASNDSEDICTESHDSKEYFCCAVLKALRDRYFQPGRVPFRIHILCLEYSDSQLCKQYTDTYSSFMIVENHAKNTFSYSFAKHIEDTNSLIFDDTVLPFLFKQLNGTATPPEYTRENMETANIETCATKLRLKLEQLFEESTQRLL